MNNKKISKKLNKIAKQLLSVDFPNQKAMNDYLKQHPKADRKNHKVVEFKPETKKLDDTRDELKEQWNDLNMDTLRNETEILKEEARKKAQQENQTKLFKKLGVFYAFNEEQLKKGIEENKHLLEGGKFIRCSHGMLMPKVNYETFNIEFDAMMEANKKDDLKVKGKKGLIWDSFANYESQIGGDYSQTINEMAEYGITAEEVQAEWKPYFDHCVKNDYF